MPKLPPLNALRAFEAAARHNGYVAASNELHVTRGAISRHIKLLEDHLGTQLFRRHAKGVELTSAGRDLLPVISEAFAMITREAERISAAPSDLRIICPPATSIRWLLPRLDAFRRAHPDIRMHVTTDFYGEMGLNNTEFDIGFSVVNYRAHRKNITVEPLFPVLLTPACAPGYVTAMGGFATPSELTKATLLHETPRRLDWADWLDRFGVTEVGTSQGDEFPNLDMATKAAIMGAGVVMADLVLCQDELASGTLVRLFPELVCVSRYGDVCLLGSSTRWDDPQVKLFRNWAMQAAVSDRALCKTEQAPLA